MCKKPRLTENTKESQNCYYPLEIRSRVGKREEQEVSDIPGHVFLKSFVFSSK